METLIHADIFFFVTTIAVVVVGIAFTAVLFYLAVVLRQVRDVMREVKDETKLVRQDMGDARSKIKREGFRLKHLIDFFSSVGGRQKAKRSKR